MELLYKQAKEYALRLLDKTYKTEKQITDKLVMRGYPQEVINRVVELLKEYDMINDYRYACMYIESNMSKKSKRRIAQDLYLKGISKEQAEQAFEELDYSEETSLQFVIDKKKSRYDLTDKKDVQKFYMYLVSKGYQYNDVRDALSKISVINQ